MVDPLRPGEVFVEVDLANELTSLDAIAEACKNAFSSVMRRAGSTGTMVAVGVTFLNGVIGTVLRNLSGEERVMFLNELRAIVAKADPPPHCEIMADNPQAKAFLARLDEAITIAVDHACQAEGVSLTGDWADIAGLVLVSQGARRARADGNKSPNWMQTAFELVAGAFGAAIQTHYQAAKGEQALMSNAQTQATKTAEKPANGATVAVTPPVASPPTVAAPKPSKPNQAILRHKRAVHKLETAGTGRTLVHIDEAIACTSDAEYRAFLQTVYATIIEYRVRLDKALAAAEGT